MLRTPEYLPSTILHRNWVAESQTAGVLAYGFWLIYFGFFPQRGKSAND
jgi:hypothetical protein